MFMAALLGAGSLLSADVVHLNDGRILRGDIQREGDEYTITQADGTVTHIPLSSVKRLELSGSQSDATGAAGRLASLRRSSESMADIDQIITRYQQFIAQSANAAIADEARQDLQTWIDRRDRGLVNYHGQWVTVHERDALRQQAEDAARQALSDLNAKDTAAAQVQIQKTLAIDPGHPLALYLQAHILIGQNKIPEARKVLDQLAAILPDHAPTLNNLAYILWKQNQLPAALLRLDQAMASAPINQTILDNVAEALLLASASMAKSTVVQKTTATFMQQDAQLQAALVQQGLYRWGGSWIDQATFARLQQQQKTVQAKMDEMELQYSDGQMAIAKIDGDIQANERAMRQMDANSYYRDANGWLIRMPLPPLYYQLSLDNDRMTQQRQLLVAKQNRLRQQAEAVKKQLPQPVYSGRILPIGLSGAPVWDDAGSLQNDPADPTLPASNPMDEDDTDTSAATEPASMPSTTAP